jgi:hypothetical protein
MHSFVKWRDALNLAPNVRAVEGIMQDYVGAIEPLMDALPADCREVLRDPLDVQAAAVTLMRAELRSRETPEEHAILHEIAHTFASAAVRMAQLHPMPGSHDLASHNPPAAAR